MTLLIDAPTRPPNHGAMVEAPPMAPPTPQPRSTAYPASTRVEVRTQFDGSWSSGFEVAEVTEDGYRIRRVSDDSVLPTEFTASEVRKERRRTNWWV